MASKAGAEDDLNTKSIVNELKEVGYDDMYSLGVQLGNPISTLKKFEHDFYGRTDRFQLEVIDYWYNNASDEELSWSKLAEALEKVGGHGKLVKRLRSKTQGPHNPLVHPRLTSSFPQKRLDHQTDTANEPQLFQQSQVSHTSSSKNAIGSGSQNEMGLPTQIPSVLTSSSTLPHAPLEFPYTHHSYCPEDYQSSMDTALQDVTDSIHKLKLVAINEYIRPLPVEDANYLKFMQENGELGEVKAAVASISLHSEVADSRLCLVGSKDQLTKANEIIDDILAHRKVHEEPIPSHISDDVLLFCDRCQRENKVLVVYQSDDPKHRQFKFISNNEKSCKEAAEWMKNEVYPMAITFLGRGKKVKTLYDEQQDQVQIEHISEVRSELERVFGILQLYQEKLKVGYEARFGQFFAKAQTKKYFFKPSVDSNNVKRVIAAKCTPKSHQLTVISPLKIRVTPKSGGEPTMCVAVVEESPSQGTFHLNQVFHERPSCLPKYDFTFERMNIGMRIAPCTSSVINDDDSEECQAVRDLVRTIRRRSDGKLTMIAKGSTRNYNYCIDFMRYKKQTQHLWRDSDERKQWILAEYDIQEFSIKEHERMTWKSGEWVELVLEEHKELELWSWKRFGPFIQLADITRAHYAAVKGAFLPGGDVPQQPSPWKVDEILYKFDEFVQAAAEIAQCLSS